MLGDEALTDYWTARRRAAAGTSPKLAGPEYTGWRRQWELAERRKLGHRRPAPAARTAAGPTSADPTAIWPDPSTVRRCGRDPAVSATSSGMLYGQPAAAVVVAAAALAQSAGGGSLIERPV